MPTAGPSCNASSGNILWVGAGEAHTTLRSGIAAAQAGDTICVRAGTYVNDFATIRRDVRIIGVGGRVHLKADQGSGGRLEAGKGILVVGLPTAAPNVYIENIEFSGAKVPDRNGAGIRAEGPNLTVRNVVFRDNENGILAAGREDSTIVIEHSEFARNGFGDGRSHGLYINRIKRLVFRHNFAHHARIGHQLKTRARENVIVGNLFMDGESGSSSYAIDMPNARVAYVLGNVLQQSDVVQNSTLIYVGGKGEGRMPRVFIANNTVINDRQRGGVFVRNGSPISVGIHNNLLIGKLQTVKGKAIESHNLAGDRAFLVDPAKLDFRLRPGVEAIDAGLDLGRDGRIDLAPTAEYQHRAQRRDRPRVGPIDIGAYEFTGK